MVGRGDGGANAGGGGDDDDGMATDDDGDGWAEVWRWTMGREGKKNGEGR